MKKPLAARLTNDNGKPEDHLAAMTLAIHTTMDGLAAPVELLIQALSFEAPVDPIAPPSTR